MRPEPFASGLASASASGKSGRSVPAAGGAVEAADGGQLPRAVPPPGGPIEIFSGKSEPGVRPCEPMIGTARRVPSGATRVRRTMNGYVNAPAKPAQAVTDFVPPSDPP
jgi:hypothetical protein